MQFDKFFHQVFVDVHRCKLPHLHIHEYFWKLENDRKIMGKKKEATTRILDPVIVVSRPTLHPDDNFYSIPNY